MLSVPKTESRTSMEVMRFSDSVGSYVATLLNRYGLTLVTTQDPDIPGSFWGDEEAGLVADRLYVRNDTPIHSILHEACHYICMDKERRVGLDTNAGGDYDEENAVCYLQVLLADHLPGLGRERIWSDMDAWGYSFRLGSARAWFEEDAEDARQWLLDAGLIDENNQPAWTLRQ